jgi:hypothetical protein
MRNNRPTYRFDEVSQTLRKFTLGGFEVSVLEDVSRF